MDSLVERGYSKRKTNKQIEHALANLANPTTGRQCLITLPVYSNVQFHPCLPDIPWQDNRKLFPICVP